MSLYQTSSLPTEALLSLNIIRILRFCPRRIHLQSANDEEGGVVLGFSVGQPDFLHSSEREMSTIQSDKWRYFPLLEKFTITPKLKHHHELAKHCISFSIVVGCKRVTRQKIGNADWVVCRDIRFKSFTVSFSHSFECFYFFWAEITLIISDDKTL